jgi:hypothetical protein
VDKADKEKIVSILSNVMDVVQYTVSKMRKIAEERARLHKECMVEWTSFNEVWAIESVLQTIVVCLKQEFDLYINEKNIYTPGIMSRHAGLYQTSLMKNELLSEYVSEWRKEEQLDSEILGNPPAFIHVPTEEGF